MRDRKLDHLSPVYKSRFFELLARFVENEIIFLVVETLRTEEQHQIDLAYGRSWVAHSKHQDGLAIDVAPYMVYALHGDDKLQWDSSDPIWLKMGIIGESLGFGWGGRWIQKDFSHFEIKS